MSLSTEDNDGVSRIEQESHRLTRKVALKLGVSAAMAGAVTPTLLTSAARAAQTAEVTRERTVTLTLFHRWSDPVGLKMVTTLFNKFEKENPGIKINNAYQPSSGDTYQPAVRTAFASSTPPDLATDITGAEEYNLVNAGVLRDLTDFYNAHIKQIATPGAIVGSVLNGKVWGFSVGVYIGNLLWYNPDYLKKYGLDASSVHTWNDWIRQLQIIKQKGGTPIFFGAKDLWPGGHYMTDLVQRTMGNKQAVALYNRTLIPGSPSTPKWTDPPVIKALQSLLDLKPYFQSGFLGETNAVAGSQFLGGQSAYYEQGLWFSETILGQPPKFKPGAILFPSFPGYPGHQTDTTIGTNAWLVSKKSPNWDAIQKFLLFFYRPDNIAFLESKYIQILPYKFDPQKLDVDPRVTSVFHQFLAEQNAAGANGTILYNDSLVNVNIYTESIWQGSVGLLSGSLSPMQLATQLEKETVAWQKSHPK